MNWLLTGVPVSILTSLGLGLGGAIVTMYLLRTRRRRVEVPYARLWQKALADKLPTRWKERLRRLLSLLVQLLLLALLLLALGNPRPEGEQEFGRSVVAIFDTSASMTALDEQGGRSRIDRAREAGLALLDSLGGRDELMLVQMDAQVVPLTPFVNDRDRAEETLRGIEATHTPGDLEQGLQFAFDALASRPNAEVVVFSDGAYTDAQLAAIAVPDGVRVTHVPVGARDGNVGVTAFNVRRYPQNRTSYEVFVEVRSFVETPVTVELDLLGEGNLIETQRIDLGPAGVETRIWSDIPAGGRRLEARVRIVAGDVVDVFAVDDGAFALLPEDRPPRVLVVTEGNLYLEAPFLLNESFDTTVIAPAQYVAPNGGDPSEGYDLTVFDGVTPQTADRGNFFFFGPTGDFSPWESSSDVADPIIHTAETGHPLLRWIAGLRDLNIAQARVLRPTEDDRVLASAIGGQPMVIVRETLRGRIGAVAFEPTESDLPLRVAFPILLINAVDWFTGADRAMVDAFATGTTWMIPLTDRSLTEVRVTPPSGAGRTGQAWDGTAVVYGDRVGFWNLEAGDTTRLLAANLADVDESTVKPRELTSIAGVTVTSEFDAAERGLARDPWVLLVIAVVVLLAIEWATWNRRLTV